MIKAKILAMCVCPAIAAPPAIIAVHAPARHAVAHLLHRAAHRLDRSEPGPAAAAAPVAVAAACAPVVATGGSGGTAPLVGGSLIGGAGGDAGLVLASAGGAPFEGSTGVGDYGGGGGGYIGGGGGASGGGGGAGGAPGGTTGSPPATGLTTIGGSSGGAPVAPAGPASPTTPGTGMTTMPTLPTGPTTLPPAGGSASPVSGAPEPAAWAFLVVGFGLVGAIARGRASTARRTTPTVTQI